MALPVSGKHIADAKDSNYEPMRKNHFQLELSGLDGAEEIKLSLLSFPVPTQTVERVTISYGNEQRHAAGGAAVEQPTLTVVDYVKPDIAEKLNAWWKKVFDVSSGAIGLCGDYKKNAKVICYKPNGDKARSWDLRGVFPTNFNPGEFSMTERGANQQITMQLSVDEIELEAGSGA